MEIIRKAGEKFDWDLSEMENIVSRKAGDIHDMQPELCNNIYKTATEGVDYVREKGVTDFNLAESYHLDKKLEYLNTIEPSEDPQPHS